VSKQVALALRDWLPSVIQAIEPWMSSEDIEKGARWSSDIAKQLENTAAGIICVTPDNRDEPWLNFEAGALSKKVANEMVCPYLFRLKPSGLTGPLVQFQASEASKEDTQKMIATLNRATAKPIPDDKLVEAFDLWWKRLEAKLEAIPSATSPEPAKRKPEDMLEEVLGIVRDQSRSAQDILFKLAEMEARDLVRPASPYLAGYTPVNVPEYSNLAILASMTRPLSSQQDKPEESTKPYSKRTTMLTKEE
jgi:hypothetical protein